MFQKPSHFTTSDVTNDNCVLYCFSRGLGALINFLHVSADIPCSIWFTGRTVTGGFTSLTILQAANSPFYALLQIHLSFAGDAMRAFCADLRWFIALGFFLNAFSTPKNRLMSLTICVIDMKLRESAMFWPFSKTEWRASGSIVSN